MRTKGYRLDVFGRTPIALERLQEVAHGPPLIMERLRHWYRSDERFAIVAHLGKPGSRKMAVSTAKDLDELSLRVLEMVLELENVRAVELFVEAEDEGAMVLELSKSLQDVNAMVGTTIPQVKVYRGGEKT